MDKILIVGRSCFVEEWLIDRLVEKDYYIKVLSKKYPDVYYTDFTFIEGSPLDEKSLGEALRDIDQVVFFPIYWNVFERSYEKEFNTNVLSCLNLISRACKQSVNRIVFVSSCDVYGSPTELPVHERTITIPRTPHAAALLSMESLIMSLSFHDINWIILRVFDVYGPKQDSNWILNMCSIFKNALLKGILELPGTKNTFRDLIYIEDLVNILLSIIELPDDINNLVINVASGEPIPLNSLVEMITRLVGRSVNVSYRRELSWFIPSIYAETRVLRDIFPRFPQYSIKEGLLRTFKWVRSAINSKSFLS